jgi:tryptophan synthase alpha subunit
MVGRVAGGFIYCVSLTGVTGARSELSAGLPEFLARVRRHTRLPLAVGFGVSDEEHVRAIGEHAEAAIVGSALIRAVEEARAGERVEQARRFVARLSQGARRTVRSG